MLKGLNKIFEKYQKLLLVLVGVIVVVPFVGFVPGADLFDIFGSSSPKPRVLKINGEELTEQEIRLQLIGYQLGFSLGVAQSYSYDISGEDRSSQIALYRYALIKNLQKKYKFDAVTKGELANFLKERFGTIKDAKNILNRIQQDYGLNPKQVERLVVDNYFIKKNDQVIKSRVKIDAKELKDAYIKKNTIYTILSLHLSSNDSKYQDQRTQKYYQQNKKVYKQEKKVSVSYIKFNKQLTSLSDIEHVDDLIVEKFEEDKKKYLPYSFEKKVRIFGVLFEDLANVQVNTVKRKLLEQVIKKVRKAKDKNFQVSNVDFDTILWESSATSAFNDEIANLNEGEISTPITLQNQKGDFLPGIYALQVLSKRSGNLTEKVKQIIGDEIVQEKNAFRNKQIAKNLYLSLKRAMVNADGFEAKKEIFARKAKALDLAVEKSPYLKANEQESFNYSKNFIKAIKNLSSQRPLSNMFYNNGSYTIAFLDKQGSSYKPFNEVKNLIEQKVYLLEAEQYYKQNPEEFKLPEIKYAYAVDFNPNLKSYKVTNAEALKYYKNNRGLFKKKQARVKTIRFDYKNSSQKSKMKKRLEAIVQDIKSGKISFEEAVKKYSTDEISKNKKEAGLVGWVTQDRHQASKEIFATKKGEISSIFLGDKNLQVFKVEQTSDNIAFSRIRKDIVNHLQRKKAIDDAKEKRNKFYFQIDNLLTNQGTKNFSKTFTDLANKYNYRFFSVSTQDNNLPSLVADLKTRTVDNPIIINENDFWVGCYHRTVPARLPKFEETQTKAKAVRKVIKKEAGQRVKTSFVEIFESLNKAENKKPLFKKYGFKVEEAKKFKNLKQAYKSLIKDGVKKGKVFTTKDSSAEHIIFVVKDMKKPTQSDFQQEKEEFFKSFKVEKQREVVSSFYKDFIKKNPVSL